jgi:ribosomal protein L16 Arg81 hydroxylase
VQSEYSLLQSWLGTMPIAEFRSKHLGVSPFASPATAQLGVDACDWRELDRMLRAHRKPDMLVVSRGRLVDEPPPASLQELQGQFRRGVGIVVRDSEQRSRSVRILAETIGKELPGRRRVLIFATPAGTHGFGWHYDAEEVLIAQTAGTKQYFFRANTLDPEPKYGAPLDFALVRNETTPIMSCTLEPGDLLYLPRGYWHIAHPVADSLSLSIGIITD